jgi:hypothetical protein
MRANERADPDLEAIVAAFERHDVAYVVIGGEAARARGWPDPTEDIDVTPERSMENLSRLADALEDLGAGFRVDPKRYPDGYRPPGGIDWRTFRNQVSVAFTTRHGHLDIVLQPDGTKGYEQLIASATRERLTGTEIAVPVASPEMILHSKTEADRPKDQAVLDRMREVLDPLSDRAGHEPWSHREGHERSRDGHDPPERER